MRRRGIPPQLASLLASGHWNDFTIADLMAAYMALPKCPHRTEKAARQFVHRNISRLERRGLVSRVSGQRGRAVRYRWLAEGVESIPATIFEVPVGENEASGDPTITCLKEKLHRYKVEMLSAIGETEEYDAICNELPHMRNAVQDLYNEARDRCSKILGRVRALESVLSNQPHWQQRL